MTFNGLLHKIGKQPIGTTSQSQVAAVFSISEMQALIDEAKAGGGETVCVPLELQYEGNGKQRRMWFALKKHREENRDAGNGAD